MDLEQKAIKKTMLNSSALQNKMATAAEITSPLLGYASLLIVWLN